MIFILLILQVLLLATAVGSPVSNAATEYSSIAHDEYIGCRTYGIVYRLTYAMFGHVVILPVLQL